MAGGNSGAGIQTVPARHGIATFVPARHSLKVINTYGTQSVDMWAFALHKPPQAEDSDEERRRVEAEISEAQAHAQARAEEEEEAEKKGKEEDEKRKGEEGKREYGEGSEGEENKTDEAQAQEKGAVNAAVPRDVDADDQTPKASPSKETWTEKEKEKEKETPKQKQPKSPQKPARSWSAYASYVPSLRSRSRNQSTTTAATTTATSAAEAATGKDAKTPGGQPQRTASSYAAYLPSLRARAKEALPASVAAEKVAVDSSSGAEKEKDKEMDQEKEKDKVDLKEDDKSLQSTSDYVSAEEGEPAGGVKKDDDDNDSGQETDKEQQPDNTNMSASAMSTKSWGSYLPSIRRGNKGPSASSSAQGQDQTDAQPTATAATTKRNVNAKGWLSYIPSGKSFTSYLPSSGKEALSAFAASHYRDPTKSYGEQLYEFSKTPVGAFSLSAAAGSGTAGSLYAAYNAYIKLQATRRSSEPMEYLSLPHTVAASTHLAPQAGDALVTNLRNPLLTLLEDTTPPAAAGNDGDASGSSNNIIPLRHGTLLPACDPAVYKHLASLAGRARGEEHGSCAENLVLALQSFNASAGLKGARAVGADVTINSVPTPLSLFLNSCVVDGGEVRIAAPRTYEGGRMGRPGQKGGFVVFRAERDVVVVLSACPMEVGEANGGRCMAANFVVEEPAAPEADEQQQQDEDGAKEAAELLEKARAYGRALGAKVPQSNESAAAVGVAGDAVKSTETLDASAGSQSPRTTAVVSEVRNRPRPGRKKPKKLERRSAEVKS